MILICLEHIGLFHDMIYDTYIFHDMILMSGTPRFHQLLLPNMALSLWEVIGRLISPMVVLSTTNYPWEPNSAFTIEEATQLQVTQLVLYWEVYSGGLDYQHMR